MRARFLTALAIIVAASGVMGADGPAVTLPAKSMAAADREVAFNPLSPRLNVVEVEGGNLKAPAGAVALEKLDINVAISGAMAETTVTLTFKNSANRVFEGELEFPLPEGVAVSGYGLDVGGIMVDGVVVEKQRARQIFESEQRKGIDPGILEQTKGNNFRTRISPIPAKGTRVAKIKFVSTLGRGFLKMGGGSSFGSYALPLAIPGKLSDANVRVEIVGREIKPTIAGLEGLVFVAEGNKLVASKAFHNVELKGTLSVTVPEKEGTQVVVERREKQLTVDDFEKKAAREVSRGEYYFMASLAAHLPPPTPLPSAKLQTVAIYWDASLSREKADKSAELALLKELCSQYQNLRIDVAPFSNAMGKAVSFEIAKGDSSKLIKFLEEVVYDGATDLSALQIAHNAGQLGFPQNEMIVYDAALLFTDGISTLGSGLPAKAKVPLFTVCGGVSVDYAALQRMAADSAGGRFINLQVTKPQDAASMMFGNARSSVTISYDEKQIADVFPRGAQPAYSPLAVTGKLLGPEATITLKYSESNKEEVITLKRADAVDSELISRYWANAKIADLSAEVSSGDEAFAIGKEFGIVTPNTSLMVLETVEQYVQYGIVPPKSHPALYKAFAEKIEQRGAEKKKTEEAKIDRVLAMWKQRVAWWEQDFSKVAVTAVPPKADANVIVAPNGALAEATVESVTREVDRQMQASAGEAIAGVGQRQTLRAQESGGQSSALSSFDRPALPAGGGAGGGGNFGGGGVGAGGGVGNWDIGMQPANTGKQALEGPVAAIAIKQWDPKTPYIAALKAAKGDEAYGVFIEQRKAFGSNPGFYLDCADFFFKAKQDVIAIRILSDIAELKLESAPLLRIAAYRLMQVGCYSLAIDLFEKAKQLRPDEPQSWRDLAQAYAASVDISAAAMLANTTNIPRSEPIVAAYSRWQKAMDLYHHVVMENWDRFPEIEVTALMEANQLWEKIEKSRMSEDFLKGSFPVKNPFDPRLVKNLACDLRIVMTWDADVTDIDLHVIEPSGEECDYSHNRTQTGGLVSCDFTQGYGPEEYCIKAARPGKYKIAAVYFGNQQQSVAGPVTVQATVITNFGKPDEKRESLTLRLVDQKDKIDIGEVKIGK